MSYIRLKSGGHFDFAVPEKSVFTLDDIAWGLAHIYRFNGQTHQPISVAQHSINVSYLVDPRIARAALLHDAAEAFLGDITTPLKAVLGERFQSLEWVTEYMVAQRLGITTPPGNPFIKEADLVCLATERAFLMKNDPGEPWDCLGSIKPMQVEDFSHAWTYFSIGSQSCPEEDYRKFLRRHEELSHVQAA